MKIFSRFAVLALSAALALPASAQEPNFGRAAVLEGDDLIVGQPVNWYGPGTVYTYRPGADGQWVEQSRLVAPDSARMDDFGAALALDELTLAVAAPRKRDGEGVVYIFERASIGGEWSSTAVIEPTGMADHSGFGTALALTGDELMVGSPAVNDQGAVYRYRRTGNEWTLAGTLTGTAQAEGFGESLALDADGDRLLIGAPASQGARGLVFAATRAGDGWGSAVPVAAPQSLGERSGFGAALVFDGDRAIVGAPGAYTVYALEPDNSGRWAVSAEYRAPDAEQGSLFGASLAASGGDIWVGAPGMAGRDGRAYRFAQDGAGSQLAATAFDPDVSEGDSWPLGFGFALAVDDGRAFVGMPNSDFGEGSGLTFSRAGSGWERGQLLEGMIFQIGEELATGDRCAEGQMTEFPCANMELVAHVPISELGGERGAWLNDVWGWTDPETNRRYALVARRDGASFLDVTSAAAPRLLGNLPRTEGSRPSVWRDIKVIGSHAFIVADGAGAHGMQVFDLTRLREIGDTPVEFEPDATYHDIFSAHNVVADAESGFVYVVGASSGGTTCGGGLHMVDVREPENPVFAGCYTDAAGAGRRGYTHDAQCLVYRGPDEDYQGRQICLGSNATELNIADVTDKSAPVTIARATYPNVSYAHQGWLDDEQRYFYMNDEGDESAGVVERTRTLVWDLSELDDPILVTEYFGPVPASDHNLFVVGDRMYQSNYGSGLRVLDISDRANPREVAHFDSAPYNNDEPGFSAAVSGAWSNYPFFEDGLVVFTSVREGLFIVRVTRPIT